MGMLVPGVNDLATTHPDLAVEALFDPTAVSAGSNRKLPWRCAKGHGWDAQPNNRKGGTGCPVCAGSRVLPGYNDLATTHPDLAAEALFDASTVSPGSNTKMLWRCARGHEWKVSPNDRTGQGRGCPYCSNKAVLPGYNDLATTRPDLASEAQFDPTTVTAGTHRNLPWRCEKGHDWSAVVKNRSLGGAGCPVCANQAVLPGYNDLATTRPDLASEAQFDPTTVTSGTHRKLPWTCTKGHEWEASVVSRTNGAGCPVCASKVVLPGYNDLATTHPHLVTDALFDPATVSAGSNRRVLWRCIRGHEWSMSPVNRTNGRQGCPYCANRRVLPGYNDLATTHPELIAEAMFDPATLTFGSNQRVPWRCALGHDWTAPITGRTSNGEGCPVCANKVVLPGYNDLATTHPTLAAEASFDATAVVAGTHQKLPWRCVKGHEWTATVNSRRGGRGCPICVNKSVLVGYNDLATTHPALVAEALFDATTVTFGSKKRVPWRCSLGHKWIGSVAHRAIRGDGCPYCSNKAVLPGYNDLATTHPQIAADAQFDPTTVTWGSHVKVSWRCQENHAWKATVKSRALSGTGCPVCAVTGYNPSKRGWLYLLSHDVWSMMQIGITNDPDARLAVHARHGWEVVDLRGPMDGVLAQGWEQSILRFLRSSGVPTTPSGTNDQPSRAKAVRGPKSGEAWWIGDFNVDTIRQLMELVHESEELVADDSL